MTVGIGDTSVLFIPPTGPPTVTVIEATSGVSSFAMTSATDALTGDVYVGLAADAAPFGMTLLLRVDGTSLVALPGAPAYPMGTILFATEAVGFDVYDGVVYPIDVFTDTISTWDSFSATTAVAGNGIEGFAGDGGSALSASFANPQGIDVTGTGIYIADSDNHRVRRVNAAGVVSTIAGGRLLTSLGGLGVLLDLGVLGGDHSLGALGFGLRFGRHSLRLRFGGLRLCLGLGLSGPSVGIFQLLLYRSGRRGRIRFIAADNGNLACELGHGDRLCVAPPAATLTTDGGRTDRAVLSQQLGDRDRPSLVAAVI